MCRVAGVIAAVPVLELGGVEDGPDLFDPVTCEVEGQNRDGGAVQSQNQAGPAVDDLFDDHHVVQASFGDRQVVLGDLRGSDYRSKRSLGQAAAVGDRNCIGSRASMRAPTSTQSTEQSELVRAFRRAWQAHVGGMRLARARSRAE
jgi:hypothetical protein